MSSRGLLARCLAGVALLLAGAIALVGALALRPAGLMVVGLAAVVTGALAAGFVRESSDDDLRATLDATWQAAAGTVGALLVLSGVAVLAGPVVTALVAAAVAAGAAVVWLARIGRSRQEAARPVDPRPASPSLPRSPSPPAAADRPSVVLAGNVVEGPAAPLDGLPIEALGREWVTTSAALGARLDPRAREAVVRRREAVLDELERRDPAGFARWLAAGPLAAGDPVRYLRTSAPGSDAA